MMDHETSAHPHHPSTLTLVSLNLLDDLDLWEQRAPLIVHELERLRPDVIGFQEVRMSINNAQWIADQLGGYEMRLCPKTGEYGRHDALAILSRLPIGSQHTMAFEHQGRVALRVEIQHQGVLWHVATTHTYWHPLNDRTRWKDAKRLVEWLPSPGVICGDFNAEPNYPSMLKMKERFQSAYVAANGHEPAYTCPTPLFRGAGARNSARRASLQLVGLMIKRKLEVWTGVVDYIFVDSTITVKECHVAFNHPAGHDHRIYASDHLGLFARLEQKVKP
jgi:endonuclease/exonuclease/phosphatase family metal-dependent hydrolase